jgi:hypothetical protein
MTGGKLKRQKLDFLRHVFGYTLTDHVHNTTIRDALQIGVLEERMKHYTKASGAVMCYEWTLLD